jgi:hypothetical protein
MGSHAYGLRISTSENKMQKKHHAQLKNVLLFQFQCMFDEKV